MTEEKLKQANTNRHEYQWCKDVRGNYSHRMKLRFDWSESCMEHHEEYPCPEWLDDLIFEAIKERQDELEKEFELL